MAQEEQNDELIADKQFPDGFGVERSSLSPDKRYGVLVPADFDHYDDGKPQNKLVEVETGRTLALIDAQTGKAGFMNHGGIQPSRWSADGSFLLWEVAGKWSPRALVLLKVENGKVKWQRDLLRIGREAILARIRKNIPKSLAENAVIDVRVGGEQSTPSAPLSFPLTVHAAYDTNPKAVEPPPKVHTYSEMEATVDADGKFVVKSFRTK